MGNFVHGLCLVLKLNPIYLNEDALQYQTELMNQMVFLAKQANPTPYPTLYMYVTCRKGVKSVGTWKIRKNMAKNS